MRIISSLSMILLPQFGFNGTGKSRMPSRGIVAQFPATEFELAMESWLSKLEEVKKDCDKRWGTDRLQKLADANFMEKFYAQQQRVWQACQDKDRERLEKSAAGMVRAYQALEAWAVQHAVPVRPAVGAVEHVGKDGKLMVVLVLIMVAYQHTLRKMVRL